MQVQLMKCLIVPTTCVLSYGLHVPDINHGPLCATYALCSLMCLHKKERTCMFSAIATAISLLKISKSH